MVRLLRLRLLRGVVCVGVLEALRGEDKGTFPGDFVADFAGDFAAATAGAAGFPGDFLVVLEFMSEGDVCGASLVVDLSEVMADGRLEWDDLE